MYISVILIATNKYKLNKKIEVAFFNSSLNVKGWYPLFKRKERTPKEFATNKFLGQHRIYVELSQYVESYQELNLIYFVLLHFYYIMFFSAIKTFCEASSNLWLFLFY